MGVLEPTLLMDSPSKAMFHQTCETLIYDIYLKILVNEDYNLLTISGEPTKEELWAAWTEIMQESSDLIKTAKSVNIFEAWKKCVYTYWKMLFIENVIFKFRSKNPITGEYFYNAGQAEENKN